MLQLGWLWPSPQIVRPDCKGFPSYESSCLLGLVSNEGKMFFNIDTWRQCYKTFFFVTDEKGKISKSACPWQEHLQPSLKCELAGVCAPMPNEQI